MTSEFEIEGYCEERFKSVKEAFKSNFDENLEVGASFDVSLNGKHVIDFGVVTLTLLKLKDGKRTQS